MVQLSGMYFIQSYVMRLKNKMNLSKTKSAHYYSATDPVAVVAILKEIGWS
jgi:hypothetical protein